MPRKKKEEAPSFRASVGEQIQGQLRGGLRKVSDDEVILSPFVDILERDDGYTLTYQVPGLQKDDLVVKVVGEELIVEQRRPEKKPAKPKKKEIVLEEIEKGRFHRSFTVTDDLNLESLRATLVNGILTVEVAKLTGE